MDLCSEGITTMVVKKLETSCVATSSKKVYLNSTSFFYILTQIQTKLSTRNLFEGSRRDGRKQ